MGKIEFYGIMENYEEVAMSELGTVKIPENANIITNYVETNELNLVLFTLPFIIIIMGVAIFKHIKTGFLNKEIRQEIQEENIKKYNLDTEKKKIEFGCKNFLKIFLGIIVANSLTTIIHEYLHAIPGALMGYNMKIALSIFGGGITWVIEDLDKIQTIIFSLTPVIVLGFIPAIITICMRVNKKNYLINWIMALFSCLMIYTSGYDIINAYNVIKNVPNGAYTGEVNGIYYWYFNDKG